MSRLPWLRQARADLLRHIASLEEMRRGSVLRQFFKVRRRSSPDPVFVGPYALFTCKRNGRTVGRRLRDPDEVRKLERQVENYHVFRRLCSQLVEVSEAICDEKDRD
jgi:hypothetical protein